MLILQYKVSFTCDRLGRCFHVVYIYACIAVLFGLLPFLCEKKIYVKGYNLLTICN